MQGAARVEHIQQRQTASQVPDLAEQVAAKFMADYHSDQPASNVRQVADDGRAVSNLDNVGRERFVKAVAKLDSKSVDAALGFSNAHFDAKGRIVFNQLSNDEDSLTDLHYQRPHNENLPAASDPVVNSWITRLEQNTDMTWADVREMSKLLYPKDKSAKLSEQDHNLLVGAIRSRVNDDVYGNIAPTDANWLGMLLKVPQKS